MRERAARYFVPLGDDLALHDKQLQTSDVLGIKTCDAHCLSDFMA